MAHHANDHAPHGAAVAISGSDLAELRGMLSPIRDAARFAIDDRSKRDVPVPVVLSDQQFARIEQLLQPLADAAQLMLKHFMTTENGAREVTHAPDDPPPSIVDPPVDVGQQG